MTDATLACIFSRAKVAIQGKIADDKFQKCFEEESNKVVLQEYIVDPDLKVLVVYMASSDTCVCTTSVPGGFSGKACYFLKSENVRDTINAEHFAEGEVTCSEFMGGGGQTLENFSLLAQEVFFPLLSNPANRAGWSGPTSKEVMLNVSSFLSNLTIMVGDSKGQTVLPNPPPEAFDEDNLPERERAHLLETSVIQWTNKLQKVLKTDPSDLIVKGMFPGPDAEVQFWASKAADLEALSAQLKSDKMVAVVSTLTELSSPFAVHFEKLSEDVRKACDEASENSRYMKTLQSFINTLSADLDFVALSECFPPMCATLLLIWQNSKTYNTKTRLSTFLQEVANAVINQSQGFVSGDSIARCIEDENISEAVSNLKATLLVCQSLKNAFFHFQAKAAKVLPEGAWDIPTDVVFRRLDVFASRCVDLLDFSKIVNEFTKLEKVILGGSNGEQLTAAILEAHADFKVAVDALQSVPYDLMDITKDKFDDDFYQFRCKVKGLERRLSAVMVEAFDDSPTLESKFKLLASFEGLLDRPIIRDDLHLKKSPLLKEYMDDLNKIQDIFHRYKDAPRVDNNLPPVAGALSWCRTLMVRAMEPIEKVRELTAGVPAAETEEAEKVYKAIIDKLKAYEAAHIADWVKDVDQTSDAKLMQPLLVRDAETRLLQVNFDMVLVRLLREVKFFLLLGLDVPANALAIFQKSEQYRNQIGNLDLVVHMYNDMMLTLHMVERPLVEKEMAHIDEVVERGISELNWKEASVDDFTKEAITTVKAVYDTAQVMKNNFGSIKKMMAEYAKVPLAERKNKPLSPADFEEMLKKLWATRHAVIAEHQAKITALLTETNQALKVNKGSPIWRAYVEYVQDNIRDALALTIQTSIRFICEQLDQANIDKQNLQPLLEIKLGLYANDVLFNADDSTAVPDADKSTRKSRRDVWQILNDWIEYFFEIGNIMTRMDGSHYVGDLKKNEGIVRNINTLKKHLDWNQKECENYRQEYTKYEFLWKTDRNAEFAKFLKQADKGNTDDAGEDGEQEDGTSKDQASESLPLEKFEEKIIYYKDLLSEVHDKPSPVEIGWLKVNSLPVKSALETWVGRWINTYTSHLYNDVTRKLNQLEALMKEVNAEVLTDVQPGDSEALKKVLHYIHQVRTQEKTTIKMFGPLRDTVSLLKKYNRNLDDYETKLLSDAPMKWDTTVNLVYKVKEKVNNLQNKEVDVIKEKVESFNNMLADFRKEYRREAPFAYEIAVPRAYDLINMFHAKINKTDIEASKLTDLERVFELTVSKHHEIRRNRSENKLLKQVWDMVSIVRSQFTDWKKTLWDDIETDALLGQCKKLIKQIKDMPKDVRGWKVYMGLETEVKNLLTVLPLVDLLHSPSMGERHWMELKKETGKKFEKGPTFCLADLLALELHHFVEIVEYIVELATKEAKISSNLKKIEEDWSGLMLEFGEHLKSGSEAVGIIKDPGEILIALEENMAQLQGMQGQGKYVEHFLEEVNKWQKDLGTTEIVIMDWLEVQGKWQSLETIFLGSKDIRQQLPEDSKRFDEIDAQFRALMVSATTTPRVLDACNVEGRLQLLETMKSGLEKCEKSLNMYLETKRKAFPRFYFLANAALLDILSNGYDPQCVQQHLGDCFDNLKLLEYTKGEEEGTFTTHAVGMHSKDGKEYVEFPEEFIAEGPVEEWLGRLVLHQISCLKEILARAKFTADNWEVEKPRQEWVFDYPAQVALTASQIIWTEETNSNFEALADGNEQAMKEFSKICVSRVESFIMLVLGKLSACDRIKVITLITVDVHNRDVIAMLIDEKIFDSSQFAWQAQMRYEWIAATKGCNVRVADAFF
jgi:dynein heavy chain